MTDNLVGLVDVAIDAVIQHFFQQQRMRLIAHLQKKTESLRKWSRVVRRSNLEDILRIDVTET